MNSDANGACRVSTKTVLLGYVEYTEFYFGGRLQPRGFKRIAEVLAEEPGYVTISNADGYETTLREADVKRLAPSFPGDDPSCWS